MSKDDLETCCMNEIFGKRRKMIAQIYTKPDKPINEDYTSLIVAKGGTVYFRKVMDTPELTAVQRGVSFVKHQLDVDATEIYAQNVKPEEIEKDVYINWCKVNAVAGTEPDDKLKRICESELQAFQRWNTRGGRND